MKFGEFLLNRKIISSEALSEALETQRLAKIKIGRLLRDLGYLKQSTLNRELERFFSERGSDPIQELSHWESKVRDHREISARYADFLEAHLALILEFRRDEITLGAVRFRDEALQAAEAIFERHTELLILREDAFHYLKGVSGSPTAASPRSLQLTKEQTDEQRIASIDPYTSLFRDAVLDAKNRAASDIHVQPIDTGVEIRFRVHGDMLSWKKLGIEHRRPLINEVKRIVNLSLAINGRAQDGRISLASWGLDLRASLLPAQYGEKIVLRLLDMTRRFDLAESGLDPAATSALMEALSAKNGVILVSGPTGSGKTTTLYSLLSWVDRSKKNVITLEDPIEYRFEGITQVQISKKLSFADALRSVLRQDPDVILVGEIRDAETADLCGKAASTGHLVLSTVHANGAWEVMSRLLNLGVDAYLLRSLLRFSSAQRLVKKLCQSCSMPLPHSEQSDFFERLQRVRLSPRKNAQFRTRNPKGCVHCKSGAVGRVPVLEYVDREMIQSHLTDPNGILLKPTVSLQEATFIQAEKGEVDCHDIFEIE